MTAFTDALAAASYGAPLVLDGGLGTLLEARGNDLSGALWSARILRENPNGVRAAHAEFVAAGADVAVTASYQLAFDAGIDDDDVERLLRRSVDLAREADARFVAASLGPFGAARADGSEYTGYDGIGAATLARWHRRRLRVIADAGADVIAIETIPELAEVQALADELAALDRPDVAVWISLSAASTGFTPATRARAFEVAAAIPGVVAVGVNCCPPSMVAAALDDVPAGTARIAYPNSGETWDALARHWVGEAGVATADAREWIASGARLVGGCCRTTPAHIAALSAALA